ncbi:MAG: haloacid dehalogenase [Dehalococcoidia bacterium]|jgi:translin|nr:MAG: haloacid dehalogenase [Dehalococcoidia bacterium]TET47477.1 MAG: haloacid dehalogenase [Dehalococcoidia bacterium]
MSGLSDSLEKIAEQVRRDFTELDAAREKALPCCREVIRNCSQAIRAVHRQEFEQAVGLLKTARSLLNEAEQTVADYDELNYTGFFRDAQKEYAEGSVLLSVVNGKPVPSPEELGINDAAYLNGLGEAVGELRRYLLDSMRQGDVSRGEELLRVMDDVYSVLVTIDFPDAITGGLRRTTDMVRGVLERTRSDLTILVRQKDLENRLEQIRGDNK